MYFAVVLFGSPSFPSAKGKQVLILTTDREEVVADSRDGIFTLLRSPGIDSNDTIPPAYVTWRPGTTTLFLLGS